MRPDDFGAIAVPLDVMRVTARADAGALHGKTFVVKENIDVEGHVSQNGNPAWAATHGRAAANAPAVDRLLEAGARLVGKAHMDEMAYSLLGANHHYGTPINPAVPDRHPGGSSSGSAVAVAAKLVDFALGTDTAGSCRAPAAFCGIFGFRPSHGAVSSKGVVPLAETLDAIGWFARDASTLEAIGNVLSPAEQRREPFASVLCLEETFADCDAEFPKAAKSALDLLRETFPFREAILGEEFWSEALARFRDLQAFEAWRAHGEWIRTTRPDFGPGIKERFEFASTVTSERKYKADIFRREAREKIDALLGSSALFVVPTAPFAAPLLSADAAELERKRRQMVRIFLLASFFGLPQISIPLAKTAGAPLAVSLIGPRGSDRSLLELARRLGRASRLAAAQWSAS